MKNDAGLTEQLIGELTGIKVALRYVFGVQALLSDDPNQHLESMRYAMLNAVALDKVAAPGLNGDAIMQRARDTIDGLIDHVSARHNK